MPMRLQKYGAEDRILQVFGIRRSGNHAIISWLVQAIGARVLHLNEVTSPDPYRSFARAHAYGFSRYELYRRGLKLRGRGGINRHFVSHLFGRTVNEEKVSIGKLEPNMAVARKDALVLSYEDWDLEHPKLELLLEATGNRIQPGVDGRRLMILRDPYNLFASLMFSGRLVARNRDYYRRVWKQYAREYLGHTSHFGNAAVRISYNRWRASEEYRRDLCRTLGIPETAEVFESVPSTGGGSSFQGVAHTAAELQTEKRWEQLQDDPHYRALFDDELRELSERIFGEAPF